MPSCEDDICQVKPDALLPLYTVVGVNHKDTPLKLRERLSIQNEELAGVLEQLHAIDSVREVVAVSTCNRIELYAMGRDAECGDAKDLISALCEIKDVDPKEATPYFYIHDGTTAVSHLFRVVCGLDSMVPGENEILGQVKAAYLAAVEAGAVSSGLTRLFQQAFNVAKDARTRTRIAERKVSVATVVADLAQRVFGRLNKTAASMIGAGKMAELTLKVLADEGVGVSVVANRSAESAKTLAEPYGAEVVGLDAIGSKALDVHILIASAAVDKPIVTRELISEAVRARKGRPFLMVDLGVPRNIDTSVADLDGVILYDIDDLQQVVSANVEYRLEQADAAGEIVGASVEDFVKSCHADLVAATISDLCAKLKRISEDECSRSLSRFDELSEAQRNEISKMAHRIVSKILHTPIATLKENARNGDGQALERSARKLFKL